MARSDRLEDSSEDRFELLLERLREGQGRDLVISSDAWDKVLALINNEEQVFSAFQLLLSDARIRGEEWDWKTRGYEEISSPQVAIPLPTRSSIC